MILQIKWLVFFVILDQLYGNEIRVTDMDDICNHKGQVKLVKEFNSYVQKAVVNEETLDVIIKRAEFTYGKINEVYDAMYDAIDSSKSPLVKYKTEVLGQVIKPREEAPNCTITPNLDGKCVDGEQIIAFVHHDTKVIHCKKYISYLKKFNEKDIKLAAKFFPKYKNNENKQIRQKMYKYKGLVEMSNSSLVFNFDEFEAMSGVEVRTNPSPPPKSTALSKDFQFYHSFWIKQQPDKGWKHKEIAKACKQRGRRGQSSIFKTGFPLFKWHLKASNTLPAGFDNGDLRNWMERITQIATCKTNAVFEETKNFQDSDIVVHFGKLPKAVTELAHGNAQLGNNQYKEKITKSIIYVPKTPTDDEGNPNAWFKKGNTLKVEIPTGTVADVRFIILHELFHALGLDHTGVATDLMFTTPNEYNTAKWQAYFEMENFDAEQCNKANAKRTEFMPRTSDTMEDMKFMALFPVDYKNKQLKKSKRVCNCGFDHVDPSKKAQLTTTTTAAPSEKNERFNMPVTDAVQYTRMTCTVTGSNMPVTVRGWGVGTSKPDLYFKLTVNDVMLYNVRNDAYDDSTKGEWKFELDRVLEDDDEIKLEWFDKDSWGSDDELGQSTFKFEKNGQTELVSPKGKNKLDCKGIM